MELRLSFANTCSHRLPTNSYDLIPQPHPRSPAVAVRVIKGEAEQAGRLTRKKLSLCSSFTRSVEENPGSSGRRLSYNQPDSAATPHRQREEAKG